MFKNRLQEYAQKTSFPLPIYTTVNECQDHLLEFKCSVTVNGARYDSPPGFKYKKEAENASGYDSPPGFKCKKEAENVVAQVAVEDLHKLGLDIHFKVRLTSTQMPKMFSRAMEYAESDLCDFLLFFSENTATED